MLIFELLILNIQYCLVFRISDLVLNQIFLTIN